MEIYKIFRIKRIFTTKIMGIVRGSLKYNLVILDLSSNAESNFSYRTMSTSCKLTFKLIIDTSLFRANQIIMILVMVRV